MLIYKVKEKDEFCNKLFIDKPVSQLDATLFVIIFVAFHLIPVGLLTHFKQKMFTPLVRFYRVV